ncbi:uncharacterized protein [Phaseolus vulgaris]|uniref:uncharacterized protein n=1 Tax=Phaseolus vulgaris TaxID=3885 RepID=UPI0035CACFFC
MSSGGSDQPSPSNNQKKGKRNYVIKLLSRLNNQNPSSSQPNTLIPSSVHGSTPPVPDATQSTPPVQDAIASTPSPRVGSNASTPPDITPSPYTNLGGTHSASAANNLEDEVLSAGDRPLIQPIGGGFYPSKIASKAITATIKQQFGEPWPTWGAIPKGERDIFFQRFKRKVTWRAEDEEKVKKNFHTKASHTLSQMFKDARQEGKRPEWIDNNVWNSLQEHWNVAVYRSKCDTAKKNRLSEKGGCLHTGGSISVHEHAIRLTEELGRSVHVDEVFQQTHIRKSTGDFVDDRSRRTHEDFENPAEEERLRSRCWLETVGGRYKGQVYGIGRVDRQDDCVGRYIQETQSSSSNNKANLEEIVELRQHIERMDAKFQNFQNFQNFMMQYLPPEAAAAA